MGWLRGDCLGKVAGRSKHVDFAYWTLFSQLTRSEGVRIVNQWAAANRLTTQVPWFFE